MNNYFPYDDKEWKQIVENAFSPDAPDPHFSEAYKIKKRTMEESLMKIHKPIKKSAIIAIAAAVLGVLTPTTTFAASIYCTNLEQTAKSQETVQIETNVDEVNSNRAYLEQTAKYQITAHIKVSDDEINSSQIMELSLGWLPMGMKYMEDGPYAGKYHDIQNPDSERGITPWFLKLEDTKNPLIEETNCADNYEEYTTEAGNKVMLIHRIQKDDNLLLHDVLWVVFEDTPYVAQLYVKGLSDEEIKKLAEGLTLVPAEEETAEIYVANTEEEEIISEEQSVFEFQPQNLNLKTVGDTVYDTRNGRNVSIRIDNATLQDNFDGLTKNNIGKDMDFSKYLDKNGKIICERSWIRHGNGINSLDETVKQDTIQQKVLILQMTYTNEGMENVCIGFNESLFHIKDNNTINYFDWDTLEDLEIFHKTKNSLYSLYSNGYSFSVQTEHPFDAIPEVKPGESVIVQQAFLVDKDSLGNLYLNLVPENDTPAIDIDQGIPILDLCGLK